MDKIWWFIINILAILLQLGFGVVAIIAITATYSDYTNQLGSGIITPAIAVGDIGLVSNKLVPALVLGFVAAVFNAALLYLLHRADKTTGKQVHFRRKTITIVGAIVCIGFAIGDIAIAGILNKESIATTALAVIAAVALIAAVGADIFKLVTFDRQDSNADHEMKNLQQGSV
ncbi:hypothetical protein F4808DRAFT_470569 [Astrocystis sublimbata]|nr:hypothetical protein F4808DRAFT_470569 [Astrocystis sublimbata]